MKQDAEWTEENCIHCDCSQETTRFDNSRRNMSSTGDLVANNSLSTLQLETIIVSEERKFPELAFTLGRATDDKEKLILIVTQRELAYCPPFGYTSRVQITIQGDCKYLVHILMRELENGDLSDEGEVHALLKRFSDASLHKFCPGIDWTRYQEHYFDVIRFDLKSVRRKYAPFYRVDAVTCKLWFELPSNASFGGKDLCRSCMLSLQEVDLRLRLAAETYCK